MESGSIAVFGSTTRPGQRRGARFPGGLVFAASALLLLPQTAWAVGNVTAFVKGSGDLVVMGDSESNGVFVGRTGEPNEFLIEGMDAGGGPTTVNGQPWVVLIASADHIRISLRAGEDQFRLDGQQPGSVTVEGGPGDDRLGIGDPEVAEDLELYGGPGDDVVDIQDSLVAGDLLVHTGPGEDQIIFFFASIHGDTLLDTGPGLDRLSIDSTPFRGSLDVDTGPNDDVVRLFDLVIGKDLGVDLGPGEDFVGVTEVSLAGKARCDGGSGEDAYSDEGGNNFESGEPRLRRFEHRVSEPEL